ncbi:MAG: hypothetical protein AAFQ99_11200, partial [Pseudomonadota bacterium]
MSVCSVVSFYEFTHVSDPRGLGEAVRMQAQDRGLLGTAILAPEGLNATLAGERDALESLLDWLGDKPGFS